MRGFRRSQSAVELMIILAISLIAILAIFSLSQQNLLDTQASIQISQAKSAVESLAKASDEVYSEGVNSTKLVYVTIPEGANLTRSSISGRSINLAIRGPGGVTDVNARTGEPVFGSWPTKPGSFWLTVTSLEGSVQIGTAVLQVTPASLYVEMFGSSTVERNITLTNYGAGSLTIDGTLAWTASETTVANTTVIDFQLASAESKNVTLSIYASASSLGPYAGSITFSSSNGETITVPIVVHVSAQGSGAVVNVSYLTLGTFKNASCNTPKIIFDSPANTTFYGFGWPGGASLTLSVYNSTGTQVHSGGVSANSTGGFAYSWSPVGESGGAYSVNVTDVAPGSMRSQFFTVVGC